MIRISDSEWKIMDLLWEEEPKTMTQLTKELYDETGWSKHTIMTFLKRLEAKGIIYYKEGVKAKQYYTSITRDEAVIEEKRNFLNRVFKGSPGLMVANMIEQGDFSEEDIEKLREMLDKSDR